MTFRVATFLAFLALLFPCVTSSHWSRRRHHEVAHRAAHGDVDIHKRQSFTNAQFTFYNVGLGACGLYNVYTDWIVALNVEQYGSGYPGPQCFKSITIQYNGKTAKAVIMDECMACPYGGLDFSRGLFDYFADESVGELYGTWWFNDDSGGGGGGSGGQPSSSSDSPSPTWEPPTTSSTPDYTPPATTSTPDYTPPATTSTPEYTPPPTSSAPAYTPPPTSTPSTTSSVSHPSSLSVLAIPTGTMVPDPNSGNPENVLVINDILVDIGIALLTVVKE